MKTGKPKTKPVFRKRRPPRKRRPQSPPFVEWDKTPNGHWRCTLIFPEITVSPRHPEGWVNSAYGGIHDALNALHAREKSAADLLLWAAMERLTWALVKLRRKAAQVPKRGKPIPDREDDTPF